MLDINKSKILTGTLQKRFNKARKELVDDYTQSNANDFFYEYCNAPLSFIIRNSRQIYSDTYYGLDFYKKILSENILNPLCYQSELAKIQEFLDEAIGKMPYNQYNKYIELKEYISNICDKNRVLIRVFNRANLNPGVSEYLDELFDLLNRDEYDKDEIAELAEEIINDKLDPYVSISTGFLFCMKYPQFTNDLFRLTRGMTNSNDLRISTRSRMCIKELMGDPRLTKICANLPNLNMYLDWIGIASKEVIVLKKPESISVDTEIVYPNYSNLVEFLYAAANEDDRIDEAKLDRYKDLSNRLDVYNIYKEKLEEDELLGDKVDSKLESVNDIIDELESQMAYLEWTDDGTPNAVIQKHIRSRQELDKEEELKNKENQQNPDDKDEKEDEESEFNESSDIPQKPKEDLPTKIQNKALDYEAKAIKKDAIRSEKFQKLKNAANSIIQRPKKSKEDVDKLVKDFDTWDDNRRKEFLLKPGNRHKLFKKLKLALMYGTVANMKLTMLPVAFMVRHFSKEKDARIRNELVKEIESEIKICEEKINDAQSSGDTKKKYELMRIHDKLKAEKQRVMLNSKYV